MLKWSSSKIFLYFQPCFPAFKLKKSIRFLLELHHTTTLISFYCNTWSIYFPNVSEIELVSVSQLIDRLIEWFLYGTKFDAKKETRISHSRFHRWAWLINLVFSSYRYDLKWKNENNTRHESKLTFESIWPWQEDCSTKNIKQDFQRIFQTKIRSNLFNKLVVVTCIKRTDVKSLHVLCHGFPCRGSICTLLQRTSH